MMRTMGNWGGTYEIDPIPTPGGTGFTWPLTTVHEGLVATERMFFEMMDRDILHVVSRSPPDLEDGAIRVTRVVWRRAK